MSEPTQDPQGPKAATLAELKAAMPEASSDFLLEQLEKGATESQALKAYNTHLAEQLKQAEADKADAVKAAEEKAKQSQQTSSPKRGNSPGASGDTDADAPDYRQLAADYQEKHHCRWSEACLAIKKRYPEARDFFGAPK